MALISGDVRRTNAIFLLVLLPIMIRLWIEAVVWRLEGGPQMVFFSLMHGGAGWLTPILIASLFAIYVYWLWVAVVGIRWLIPKSRSTVSGAISAIAGGLTVFGFFETGTFLQENIGNALLYGGVAFMSALGLFALGLIAVGLWQMTKGANAAA